MNQVNFANNLYYVVTLTK